MFLDSAMYTTPNKELSTRKDAEHISMLCDSVSDKHPLEFVGQVHQIV
jgi:hypothetical protein